MPRIFLNYPTDSACVYHRLIEPARFCSPDWRKVGCDINVGEGIPDDHEWVGFTGLPTALGYQAIASVKTRGVKLLWSVDDDYLTIPQWSPAHRSETDLVWHAAMKQIADLILVSTPHLASLFADVADKVVCAPNLTDLSRFPAPPPVETDSAGRLTSSIEVRPPVRCVWSGSVTHKGDIDILGGVIDRVLQRIDARMIRFVFFGSTPPGSLLRDHLHRGVLYQQPVAFGDYRQAVNNLRPDVWLAPLADIPFNLSKSNLRVMEGWALNAAVVASPVGEYNVVRPGIDGRLCDDADAWVSALCRLATDHQHRIELAVEGRRRVERELNWSRRECRGAWDALFSRVFGIDPPE